MKETGKPRPNEKEIKVEGHLIDSMILTKIWDRIMELGGDFDTLEFRVGKHKTDPSRSEEHTSELQSRLHLVCRLLLEKKKIQQNTAHTAARNRSAND